MGRIWFFGVRGHALALKAGDLPPQSKAKANGGMADRTAALQESRERKTPASEGRGFSGSGLEARNFYLASARAAWAAAKRATGTRKGEQLT